jgi:hypothetical protein
MCHFKHFNTWSVIFGQTMNKAMESSIANLIALM